MTKAQHTNLAVGLGLVALMVLAVTLRAVKFPRAGLIRTVLYGALLTAWGVSLWWRILQRPLRRCLMAVAGLMIYWLSIRLIRYDYVTTPHWERWTWYCYYLPMLLIPTLALFVSLFLGRAETWHPDKKSYLLFAPPLALVALVLTNDLHQTVFVFAPGQAQLGDPAYTYGWGYYLCAGWMVLCGVLTLVRMVRRCRVPRTKRFLWLPVVPMLALLAYTVLYGNHVWFIRTYIRDITVVFCLCFAAVFEACIQCGLIPSNVGYAALFEASATKAEITDADLHTLFRADQTMQLTDAQKRVAVQDKAQLDRDTLLKSHAIRGGRVFWQEDIRELADMLEQLRLTQEELQDTGDILRAETEQQAKLLRLTEQNRLYDLVEQTTAPQLALMQELLAQLRCADSVDAARERLGRLVVLGTYLKRRSNLIFVSDKKSSIDTMELRLCLNESAEALRLYGVTCAIKIADAAEIPTASAEMMYTLFEALVESTLPGLTQLLLYAEPYGTDWRLRVSFGCAAAWKPAALQDRFADAQVDRDEDGLWYLALTLPAGKGDAP